MQMPKLLIAIMFGIVSTNASFADINGIDLDIDGSSPISYSADGTNCDGGNLPECTSANLKPGDWLVNFSYGVVKGRSKCSGQNGLMLGEFGNITENEYRYIDKRIWTTDENMLDTAPGDKQYCWCKSNGLYSLKTDTNPKTSFSQAPWVFHPLMSDAQYCTRYCAEECTKTVKVKTSDRAAAFFGTYAMFKSSGDTEASILCENNVDTHLYVHETDICLPVDVCNSSDGDVRNRYCIKSVDDIDISIKGTHARVYSYNDRFKTRKCIVNISGKGADWPATDCEKIGLKLNEWGVRFPYGTVKGLSKCSGFKGTDMNNIENMNATIKITTTDENLLDTTDGEKKFCWCKADALYRLMTDATPESKFTQNPWVYVSENDDAYSCDVNCEERCATEVRVNNYNFRQPMFFGK
ncbi:MAG: hypothetical protein IJS34_02790 [Alphaproteobacteria bacterium]|nr:hypothetical protein [Alphaproteobacteria bacterium]